MKPSTEDQLKDLLTRIRARIHDVDDECGRSEWADLAKEIDQHFTPIEVEFWYSLYDHREHADTFMTKCAKAIGFEIVSTMPQSLADAWQFRIKALPYQLALLEECLQNEHRKRSSPAPERSPSTVARTVI